MFESVEYNYKPYWESNMYKYVKYTEAINMIKSLE